jgi:hypothetical protein
MENQKVFSRKTIFKLVIVSFIIALFLLLYLLFLSREQCPADAICESTSPIIFFLVLIIFWVITFIMLLVLFLLYWRFFRKK